MGRLMPRTRGGWLAATLLVLVLAVAAIQVGGLHSYLAEAIARLGEGSYGPDASLIDLNDVDRLQSAFNQDVGRPRLILLLSPT